MLILRSCEAWWLRMGRIRGLKGYEGRLFCEGWVEGKRRHTPFSLSTRNTTTTSLRPTRMSFCIDRIRRRESSESRIMPSMLSYSSNLT